MIARVAPSEPAGLTGEHVLIGFLAPLTDGEGVAAIARTGATAFAMEAIPRISRAQSMDALSSQATVAGYRSVLIAAQELRPLLPDADDRRRHDPARPGARARRRGRRAAGDRDSIPSRADEIGVPKETAEGERRVARRPRRRAAAGRRPATRSWSSPVRGTAAGVLDDAFTDAGAELGDPWSADVIARVAPAEHRRAQRRPRADRLPRPAHQRRGRQGHRRHRRDRVRHGGDPAHLARAVDGRAVLAGDRRRLPRRADRRAGARPLLPDADDRRRHDPARPGARARRRASPGCRRSPPPAGWARS